MPEVLMPRLSDTMQEGVLSQWRKHEGDPVHQGDVLAEIETDKATMELEAYDEGTLSRLLVEEGATIPIGTPIAVIDTPAASAAPAPSPPAAAQQPATPPTVATPTPPSSDVSASRASPLARRIAREHGVDLATISGSGPGGRIVRGDIEAAIAANAQPGTAPPPTPTSRPPEPPSSPAAVPLPVAGPDVEELALTRMRRLTAQRLTQSAQQAPHFYLTRVVDADPLLAFRKQVNADLESTGIRVSVTDLLVKACAQALTAHPEVNSSWADTRVLRYHRVHIAVAVALDDGLVAPVIHDAHRKTLSEISREAHDLVTRARAGRLSVEDITGGTFTISNLGMYGIDQFTAVINPPEAAILAVGAATPNPIVRDGQLSVGTTMTLTLSIDHRVIDGATGARFLTDLTTLLQQPIRIVL
ncbi:MAG TPA: dihydrolipoamide acetyltransferase family protein [Pseudonocardiaceae bacterium]|jgi:pyruvate dehydrogenase E2 component (dihydrolipoamide acetyltransferase)|nr:dihydrolipoamide acetyltransferase family protein [Pseudonocardiaceae bacterium]